MPQLPARFRDVLEDEPLPLTGDYADVFELFSTRDLRFILERGHNLLGEGVGPELLDLGLLRPQIPAPLAPPDLGEHPGFATILRGEHSLRQGEIDQGLITLVQQAMQAVGARVPGAPEEMLLADWGADGSFGREFRRALHAMRRWLGSAWSTGPRNELGQAEAVKLVELLESRPVPDFWRELPRAHRRGPATERIVAIARGICEATSMAPYRHRVDGRSFIYTAAHFGVAAPENGLLAAPDGIGYGLRTSEKGYWKCNIFGGIVLGLAELPVPTFRVGRYRHYPRAERFGDRLARKPGWRVVHYVDHRDPAEPTSAIVGEQQERDIERVLRDSEPGDMFFVDHPGDPGDNGGHTRVCLERARPGDSDVAPLWAMAAKHRALERRDGLAKLGNGQEIQFWLLRYRG